MTVDLMRARRELADAAVEEALLAASAAQMKELLARGWTSQEAYRRELGAWADAEGALAAAREAFVAAHRRERDREAADAAEEQAAARR